MCFHLIKNNINEMIFKSNRHNLIKFLLEGMHQVIHEIISTNNPNDENRKGVFVCTIEIIPCCFLGLFFRAVSPWKSSFWFHDGIYFRT